MPPSTQNLGGRIVELLALRRATIVIANVESHRSAIELFAKFFLDWADAVGNEYADAFARRAAQANSVPCDIAFEIFALARRATLVWRYLASVGAAIAKDAASARPHRTRLSTAHGGAPAAGAHEFDEDLSDAPEFASCRGGRQSQALLRGAPCPSPRRFPAPCFLPAPLALLALLKLRAQARVGLLASYCLHPA